MCQIEPEEVFFWSAFTILGLVVVGTLAIVVVQVVKALGACCSCG